MHIQSWNGKQRGKRAEVKESADAGTGRGCSMEHVRSLGEERGNLERAENDGGGGETSEMNGVMEEPKQEEGKKEERETARYRGRSEWHRVHANK